MARFDVKRVNSFEWVGIGAAVVALIVVHAPWFVANGWGLAAAEKHGFDPAPGGWELGFLTRFSVLLLTTGAVAVLLPHFGIRVRWRSAIWIVTAALPAILIPLSRNSFVSSMQQYGYTPDVSIWFYVAMGAAWLSTIAAALNTRVAPAAAPPAGS